MPTLVLVHIGNHFPEYINDCIAQVRAVSPIPIHLLINEVNISKVSGHVDIFTLETIPTSDKRRAFEKKNRLDGSSRNGFWKSCMMRFFYLYEHVASQNLTDVFHIENDNLVYIDFLPNLAMFQTKPMWCVMDAPERCIPSFLYFNTQEILSELLDTCIEHASRSSNDMHALASFHNNNPDKVGALPIISHYQDTIDPMYAEHATAFGMLFDGAAIGQYIGGVDPRNSAGDTRGFINETTVIKCNKVSIIWRDGNPVLNGLPLVNLHIHSKDLARWSKKKVSSDKVYGTV
jgi:hypothetical protein